MAASEAAVTAAQNAICDVHPSTRGDRPHGLCTRHSVYLTDRGCPVAVAAADAVWPIAQAETLREAAHEANTPINRDAPLYGRDMASLLFRRADRIEAV